MEKANKLSKDCENELKQHCNNIANQYVVLVAIFSSIIAQEIENDEDLGILGSFLVAVGEELALASEMRIACKAKYGLEEENDLEAEIDFDRGYKDKVSQKTARKIKRIRKSKKHGNKSK